MVHTHPLLEMNHNHSEVFMTIQSVGALSHNEYKHSMIVTKVATKVVPAVTNWDSTLDMYQGNDDVTRGEI